MDLEVPAPFDPALLTVLATLLWGFGVTGLVTGWVDRRTSLTSLVATATGALIFVWLWGADRDGFRPISVPHAFVEIVARILR